MIGLPSEAQDYSSGVLGTKVPCDGVVTELREVCRQLALTSSRYP